MKLKLHHLNLTTKNVPAMDEFYRDVLDLQTESTLARQRITTQGYAGDVAFITDGATQFHIAEKDMGIKYSDYGGWAMSGWHQIFFYDPDGNVIEVHQAPEGTA